MALCICSPTWNCYCYFLAVSNGIIAKLMPSYLNNGVSPAMAVYGMTGKYVFAIWDTTFFGVYSIPRIFMRRLTRTKLPVVAITCRTQINVNTFWPLIVCRKYQGLSWYRNKVNGNAMDQLKQIRQIFTYVLTREFSLFSYTRVARIYETPFANSIRSFEITTLIYDSDASVINITCYLSL